MLNRLFHLYSETVLLFPLHHGKEQLYILSSCKLRFFCTRKLNALFSSSSLLSPSYTTMLSVHFPFLFPTGVTPRLPIVLVSPLIG
ncbi:hypothetical protein CW304_19195 [Bacillus sp. UFRGS-B20]|nr:hypothetical protein CW304_19195 [Bacillus sp. UFRGS-B20]